MKGLLFDGSKEQKMYWEKTSRRKHSDSCGECAMTRKFITCHTATNSIFWVQKGKIAYLIDIFYSEWNHLLMEEQIPLDYCFQQILWNFTKFVENVLSTLSKTLQWKTIFHTMWKTGLPCNLDVFVEGTFSLRSVALKSTFSTTFVENWVPQNWMKSPFQWNYGFQ